MNLRTLSVVNATSHPNISVVQNFLSCMSACGECLRIGCYNGTNVTEGNVPDDYFEHYDNLFENFF